MLIATTTGAFANAWSGLAVQLANFLPKLIVAIIVFIAGWIIGAMIGRWIRRALRGLNLDRVWQEMGVHDLFERAGYRFDLGRIIGGVIKWLIILIALFVALDVLGLEQVNQFMQAVLAYIPNVIAAAIILIVAGLFANFLSRLAIGGARAIGGFSPAVVSAMVKWSILGFGFLAAAAQLGIATPFLQMLFGGIVLAVSLAIGLAFGLGGRDKASRLLEGIQDGRRRE